MREIKFRAWDTENKKMEYGENYNGDKEIELGITFGGRVVELDHEEYYPSITRNPLLILMQYTGLKDKNGKEVYEGDLLRCFSKDGGVGAAVWEVFYKAPKFIGRCRLNGGEPSEHNLPNTKYAEVIGNIYEQDKD